LVESAALSIHALAHALCGKPVSTFPGYALVEARLMPMLAGVYDRFGLTAKSPRSGDADYDGGAVCG
jgi:hypothetical protein